MKNGAKMFPPRTESISGPVQEYLDKQGPVKAMFWNPNGDTLVVCLPHLLLSYYPDDKVWSELMHLEGEYIGGTVMRGVLYVATTDGVFIVSG